GDALRANGCVLLDARVAPRRRDGNPRRRPLQRFRGERRDLLEVASVVGGGGAATVDRRADWALVLGDALRRGSLHARGPQIRFCYFHRLAGGGGPYIGQPQARTQAGAPKIGALAGGGTSRACARHQRPVAPVVSTRPCATRESMTVRALAGVH